MPPGIFSSLSWSFAISRAKMMREKVPGKEGKVWQPLLLSLQPPRWIYLLPEPRGSEKPEHGGGFGSGPEVGEELSLDQGNTWRESSLLPGITPAAGELRELSHLHRTLCVSSCHPPRVTSCLCCGACLGFHHLSVLRGGNGSIQSLQQENLSQKSGDLRHPEACGIQKEELECV